MTYISPLELNRIKSFKKEKKMELVKHTKKVFADFFQSAHRDGALDVKTKMLIHIALTLAMRCEP